MRRTETLRLVVLDRSVLARNMYQLLFADLPGFQVEYTDSPAGLVERQRRARPHVVIVNGNLFADSEAAADSAFLKAYPTILLLSPRQNALKALAGEHDDITTVEKPFYPYDLITVINRVAGIFNPLSPTFKESQQDAPKKKGRPPGSKSKRKTALSS